MPSRIAARQELQRAQRAAIIAKPPSLPLRLTVLCGRLQLALVVGSLAASLALTISGIYLQFRTWRAVDELHHHQPHHHQFNSTLLISRLVNIDLQAFHARLAAALGSRDADLERHSGAILLFVGATSAVLELLLLVAVMLEQLKASLMICLLLAASLLHHQLSSTDDDQSLGSTAASVASTTFQLAFLVACLLFAAAIRVKVSLADRLLLKSRQEEIKMERRLNNA